MIEKKLIALVSECSFNLSVIEKSLEIVEDKNDSITTLRFTMDALKLLTSTYYIYPDNKYVEKAQRLLGILTSLNARFNLQNDPIFKTDIQKTMIEALPALKDILKDFMQNTHKILTDFRNQNFIEPTELTICVENDAHKKLLDS